MVKESSVQVLGDVRPEIRIEFRGFCGYVGDARRLYYMLSFTLKHQTPVNKIPIRVSRAKFLASLEK